MGIMLSPPLLDGTIPAFYSHGTGIELAIPYSMNRVVSLSQVSGFQIKIKTIQSGNQLVSIKADKMEDQKNLIIATIGSEDAKKFILGQFYKIQVAYIDNENTIGYYSTVGVAKYTSQPNVYINGLDILNLKAHTYTYTGVYEQTKDKTERVYSYRFNLYDNKENLISTSGDLLHNAAEDDWETPGITSDTYTFTQDLPMGENYYIEYGVKTINGLEEFSNKYRITQKTSISPELKASLNAEMNYENGYVSLSLVANSNEELARGSFIVARASEDSNYTVWEEIHRFSLEAQIATRKLCKDFTVEQGKKYKYSIQQYNDKNLYSNRLLSNEVVVDFEDAFLYDGKRQLKIKYNPKVSSFKKNLLETKTDTIGGQHPFIFRNGKVYYAEFPISGLISYQSDEEQLFMSEDEYGLEEKTINFVGNNIAAERAFKLRVLEWLTNGEPKVFRSPTEGNYIVRLMNSSLSPNDTTGRMLHTFNCTAYEVAEFNYSTLGEMGFITVDNQIIKSIQWETIEFKGKSIGKNLIKGRNAKTLRLDNMTPGDVVKITFKNKPEEPESIKIGVTGSYYIDVGMDIIGVSLDSVSYGSMTYSYQFVKAPTFQYVNDVEAMEVPHRQFIGEKDIVKELTCVKDSNGSWVENPKIEISKIYRIDVEKRPLQRIVGKMDHDTLSSLAKDPFIIYEIGQYDSNNPGVSPGRPGTTFKTIGYYDAFNNIKYTTYNPSITLNDENINVNELEHFDIHKPEDVKSLTAGNGVIVNITYSYVYINFTIENETSDYLQPLQVAIANYKQNQLEFKYYIQQLNSCKEEEIQDICNSINNNRIESNELYTTYIIELVKARDETLKMEGKT